MRAIFSRGLLFLGVIPGMMFSANASDQMDELLRQVEALSINLDELRGVVQQQQERIDALEQENTQLKERVEAPAAPPPPPPAPATGGRGLQAFNPEIGAVVDITGALTQSGEDAEGNDKLSIRELELIIGHEVDPYGRFDSTIVFSDFDDVELEEAYITYWDLPWDVQAKVGRLRPRIGKASTIHRDQLDTVDDPLVVRRYLGVEGLSRTSLELSRYLPSPLPSWTHELVLGVMEGGVGEDGTLFGDTRRRPSLYAHLKNFWDISHATSFELGLTYLTGSKDDDGRFEVNALGVDATWTHNFTSTRKLKLQSELYAQSREETVVFDEDGLGFRLKEHPYGFYGLVDYRATPRWEFGARYDYVELVDNYPWWPHGRDYGYSAFLTFHQSEFARLRFQYEHTDFANGGEDNAFYLQGTYAVGVHKHAIK